MKVRVIIGLLTFSMFFMYQMNRMNISICIVAMAKEELANNNTSTWDSKPYVFGAFFYACWTTELIGGFLFAKFGCRLVMAVAFLLNAISSFLFPIAYWTHPLLGILVRVIQGITLGCTFPAMAWLSSKWIPKNERARFMSAFHGSTLGASFTNLIGGIIIDQLGWPYVFYITGILCIIWVLCWWPFAYDSPHTHPRISEEELKYLKANVEANTSIRTKSQPIPWFDIFTSIPFWAIVVLFCCLMWMSLTLMQMATYFDSVHSLNIKTNGLLLSIPDLVKLYVGIQFPMVVDKFITNKKLKVSTARKLSVGLGYLIPGFLMILLAFFGNYHPAVAASIIIISVALNGAGASSLLAGIVDISPNHAGIIMGIVKTIANIPAVLCPIIVKYILYDGDPKNWKTIFLITAVLLLVNTTIYLLFSSTEIQPWNNKEIIIDNDENIDLMEKNKTIHIIQEKN